MYNINRRFAPKVLCEAAIGESYELVKKFNTITYSH
jgi:hypothetical protein